MRPRSTSSAGPLIAARLLADLFYLGVLLLVVWFFSSRYRSSGPLIPAAVLLIAASIGELVTMPVWQGFALSLAALLTYLVSHGLGRYRLWVVAGSGVLTGLALLCRINFGGYAVAVVMLDLLLHRVPGKDHGRPCSTRLGNGDARRVRGAGRGVCGRRVSGRVTDELSARVSQSSSSRRSD